jgi:PQQ-like domain
VLWSFPTNFPLNSSPTVANGKLYVSLGGVLYAFGLPR